MWSRSRFSVGAAVDWSWIAAVRVAVSACQAWREDFFFLCLVAFLPIGLQQFSREGCTEQHTFYKRRTRSYCDGIPHVVAAPGSR